MRHFHSLVRIIDLKSLLISALAVLSTWLCRRFGILADFPLTLIATAIVFPIVFSIGTAYQRREKSLEEYGSIKAHGRALYLSARDWLDEPVPGLADEIAGVLADFLRACRNMFLAPVAEIAIHERGVYDALSRLSMLGRRLRAAGLAPTECSRYNQYLSRLGVSFENIKHIFQYRTPRTLRAFSDFFILVLPVLYGPYFAHLAADYSEGLLYVTPVLFTLILVGLSNIQHHLENPFDGLGTDDVAINAEKFVASLTSEGRQGS